MGSKTLSSLYQAHILIYYEPDWNTPLIFVLGKASPIVSLLHHYHVQNNGLHQYKGMDKLLLTVCSVSLQSQTGFYPLHQIRNLPTFIHFCFYRLFNGSIQQIFKCILNVFGCLGIILLKQLLNDVSFTFSHYNLAYRFLFSFCHNKRSPMIYILSQKTYCLIAIYRKSLTYSKIIHLPIFLLYSIKFLLLVINKEP